MKIKDDIVLALDLFQKAFEHQMRGDLEMAIKLYKESISTYPTAEAHTYLGWTYSFLGRLDDAIAECLKAIDIDPDYGNPYNDIGAYLIEKGKYDEAIPWLEKATRAKRYEAPHYPHYNLGRVYLIKEMYSRAIEEFQRALDIYPEYTLARQALDFVRRKLN